MGKWDEESVIIGENQQLNENVAQNNVAVILHRKMSYGMWFPTMCILTSVDSDKPVQPPFKLRYSK